VRDGEEQSLNRVVQSLATAFPHLPESHVRDCVLRIHERFADARIRTYLPILVARRAQAVLSGTLTADDVPARPDPTEQDTVTVGIPGSETPEQP
jgi:hypothetical protein